MGGNRQRFVVGSGHNENNFGGLDGRGVKWGDDRCNLFGETGSGSGRDGKKGGEKGRKG